MKKEEINEYYSNIPNKTADLMKSEKLLNQYKESLPPQREVRINRTTSIMVDAKLTKDQVKAKVEKWKKQIDPLNVIYND